MKETSPLARVLSAGTYAPDNSLPALQQTYDLRAMGATRPTGDGTPVVAPPLQAKRLTDIPVVSRVQAEEDLRKR
ncbi:MAG: hypothetical protein DDT20_00212 [Firmicutes bacterium]|nr:hypothetical protein [Bacillota bacterium]